jgi:protein-disulfide isomerase
MLPLQFWTEPRKESQFAGEAAPTVPTATTVSIEDEPFKGHKNTKVVLVEFSDYQCPFCARFFTGTFPQIEKDHIATGKIKYVLRDFPIESMHPDAFKAHEAANCAGEQGKYWEMHDRLFQNQNKLGAADLPKHAQAIEPKPAEFEQCLKSGRRGAEIRKDIADGQKAGVQGTPTFFLGIQDREGKTIKVLRTICWCPAISPF